MSLTSFLDHPDIKARFRPFRPKNLGKLPQSVVTPTDTVSASLVGTAFDYFMRFEVERLHTGVLHQRPWVATESLDHLKRQFALTPSGRRKQRPDTFFLLCERIFNHAVEIHKEYASLVTPTTACRSRMASSCLDLARFDLVLRIGKIDDIGKPKREEDIQDLVKLIEAANLRNLLVANDVWLNPTFGLGSKLMLGADADLIAGDVLIDIKTTIKGSVGASHLDQLLGYFLLNRLSRHLDPSAPTINWCALYFSRQAHTIQFPTTAWTTAQDFGDLEGWFFASAFKNYRGELL